MLWLRIQVDQKFHWDNPKRSIGWNSQTLQQISNFKVFLLLVKDGLFDSLLLWFCKANDTDHGAHVRLGSDAICRQEVEHWVLQEVQSRFRIRSRLFALVIWFWNVAKRISGEKTAHWVDSIPSQNWSHCMVTSFRRVQGKQWESN